MINKSNPDLYIRVLPEKSSLPYCKKQSNYVYQDTHFQKYHNVILNEWQWCDITVSVSWNGLEVEVYESGQSFINRYDFLESDVYQQLLDQALIILNDKVNKLIEAYSKLK